jgi:hypothetical protein
VSSSQAWLVAHDYRLLAALDGVRTRNVTAVRRGDIVRGEVQTMAMGATPIRVPGTHSYAADRAPNSPLE